MNGPEGFTRLKVTITFEEGFPVFNGVTDFRCKYCNAVVKDYDHRDACFFLRRPIVDLKYIDPECPYLKQYKQLIGDET